MNEIDRQLDEEQAAVAMSLYYPDPATLYPAMLADGWHVMDKFGKLDGPYGSASEAWVVIHRESAAQDGERALGRHPSYGGRG